MAAIDTRVYASGVAALRAEPESKQQVSLNYGKLRYMADSYTIPAADELGTDAVIEFFTIPKGARVIEMMFSASADGGTTGKLEVGWEASVEEDSSGVALEAADPDGFFTSTQCDWSSALARLKCVVAQAGYRKKFAAAVKVVGDCKEATTDSGSNVLLLEAFIVVE